MARLDLPLSHGQEAASLLHAEIAEHDSIGRLYALVTHALGMSPLEHEYKVMGLAPYAQDSRSAATLAAGFQELFELTRNPLVWRRRRGVPSMYAAGSFLRTRLAGLRFDVIAAGAQRFMEEFLTAWVTRAVRETGIQRVACSGGVFMNVKANLAILEGAGVEDLYVFPSCGDESNSIGAACWVAASQGQSIGPLGSLYYGDPIPDPEVESAIRSSPQATRLRAQYSCDIERLTAQKLAEGKIVARAKGPIEFGARALGNRSILARADRPEVVRRINRMIKNRDFWMPFAPSVLAQRAPDYYCKPKPVSSNYMMMAFRSRPDRRERFFAAQHPHDFTTRPQEVEESHNPEFYRLLKEFEVLTGEGIVLNTSLNLHGEPIAYRAQDALDVLLRSGLECLALGNWWIEKQAAS